MIIPNFKSTIGIYNIRKYEEHAYRTTLYVAKNKLLVLEMRNDVFTLEIVDNAKNSWHSIEEYEFVSEDEIVAATYEYLRVNCGFTEKVFLGRKNREAVNAYNKQYYLSHK